jgi:endonuclease/exonuclease/phosphatase family metal-dependent hydrolase
MAIKFRLLTKRFFIYSNITVVILFLLACLVPYLNPQTWWLLSFLGLGFPFLLFLVIAFLVGWVVLLKWRLTLISAIALLIGIKSISVFWAFSKPTKFNYTKEPNTLRVMSWNVARFIEWKKNNNKGSQTRLKMFDLIKEQNADVLCLQEFHTSTHPEYYNNIEHIQQQLGYPYYYFSFDEDGDLNYYSSIIFSRYPIIDSGRIRYMPPAYPDVLLEADILFNKDTVRIFTTHLQSLQFGRKDYAAIEKIKNAKDSLVKNTRGILSKMKKGVVNRSLQADVVNKIVSQSPGPVILCADLNDVPNSYAYNTVKGNMQDAFLKKGLGIGRTFSAISPTLRIDYIFADKRFKVKQFTRVKKKLSDHYMLVADVELKKPPAYKE